MKIHWLTIIAQLINFFILVWLLKRFLYKPILNAIDARDNRIASEVADADQKKAEAKKESDEFKQKNEKFDQQRAELMEKAVDEANAERQRILDEARKAADELSAKRKDALKKEEQNLFQTISRQTQKEIFAIARKALNDLANTNLEEHLVDVFIRRLHEMDDQAKANLSELFKKSSEPVIVHSAFELPKKHHTAIQKALNETFSTEIHVQFETVTDLISGIELIGNGQKVAWSISDYLESLEKSVSSLLNAQVKSKPKGESANNANKKDISKTKDKMNQKTEKPKTDEENQ